MSILLLDIGNTNTHLGLANSSRVTRQADIPTSAWRDGQAKKLIAAFAGKTLLDGAALCSVVPKATRAAHRVVRLLGEVNCLELTPKTLVGIGMDYPKPSTIGPDRLANAVAAHHHFGAPVVSVDFGTAVTFEVINSEGKFVGGIIAPGLAAMTDYLHEKTALLPRIKIQDPGTAIGKSTEQAMQIAAVAGFRGMIRELLVELKRELRSPHLPVVATGSYAKLMAANLPEITAIEPRLTHEGLRLVWFGRKRS
jgi:type III pantothenate kinase